MTMRDDGPGGRVLVFTGEGKGKTTAAVGQAVRLAGHGRRVLLVQFAKGSRASGERVALERLSELITVKPLGAGWLDLKTHPRREEHVRQVAEAWTDTRRLLESGDYDDVVLDEVVFVVGAGFLPVDAVLAFLDAKPRTMTVVMTGRGDVPALVARADTVTDMKKIKHPFDDGRPADAGVEY